MPKKQTKQPKVSDALIEALEEVLLYLWEAEHVDYLAARETEGPASHHHIFLKLAVIRHWLDSAAEKCGRG